MRLWKRSRPQRPDTAVWHWYEVNESENTLGPYTVIARSADHAIERLLAENNWLAHHFLAGSITAKRKELQCL